jgi:hypothetical protein
MPKDGAARPTLDMRFEYAGLSLRFSAREALGAPEQTLLLVLLELAHEQHRRRPLEHMLDHTRGRSGVGCQLWSALHAGCMAPMAGAPPALMLSCSWSELHRRCGAASAGGSLTESRRRSLVRLCEVTVWERDNATRTVRSCRLVSWLIGDDQRVHVAINYRLAAALLAPGYAQVLLSERLRLPSQTAMLLHAFLSTCLGAGKTMPVGYQTLADRLWPLSGAAVPPGTRRRRLCDVRAALRAIGRLEGWRVELGAEVATVSRSLPRAVAADDAAAAPARPPRAQPPGTPAAREMTRSGHFAVPEPSYGEQSYWQKLNRIKALPRNDEAGTTLQ